MIFVPIGPAEQGIGFVEGLGARSGFGDDWLRIWGLKFVMDGGVAGAAMDEPFADNPGYTGHLNWDPDEMSKIVSYALAQGWKVATHAVGDRSVRTLLDVYEQALAQNPGTPVGSLVIEHAFLVDDVQRRRAIRLGVAITVQHQLLYTNGAEILRSWGEERASRVMPLRSWLENGAMIAAGSDAANPFDPMLNVWGFATRQTKDVGVQGADEAVDVRTALELYTRAGAQLVGEESQQGSLEPGLRADIVAFRQDPLEVAVDALPTLKPVLTMVGGKAAYDAEGLLG